MFKGSRTGFIGRSLFTGQLQVLIYLFIYLIFFFFFFCFRRLRVILYLRDSGINFEEQFFIITLSVPNLFVSQAGFILLIWIALSVVDWLGMSQSLIKA